MEEMSSMEFACWRVVLQEKLEDERKTIKKEEYYWAQIAQILAIKASHKYMPLENFIFKNEEQKTGISPAQKELNLKSTKMRWKAFAGLGKRFDRNKDRRKKK